MGVRGVLMRGKRVYLRLAREADGREFSRAVRRSRKLHRGWVNPPELGASFRAYLRRENFKGLLICRNDSGEIVGVINLSQIFYGAFQSAYLGFYAMEGHQGQGLMREGLRLAIRYAFEKLKLHRVEANIQPGNVRSIGLVKGLGFRKEGFSPRYLKVAGRWRDHERWAKVRG